MGEGGHSVGDCVCVGVGARFRDLRERARRLFVVVDWF